MKKYLPGLLITIVIAIVAQLLSRYLHVIGAISLAIILGIVVGNLYKFEGIFGKGIQFAEKNLLLYAIVLMGFNLKLLELKQMGSSVFLIVLPTMAVTFGAALVFARLLGFSHAYGLLMGAGNAVCGSSAIAAVAPVTTADEEEIGVSIGIVNLLGTGGMFILPLLAGILQLSQMQSSYLIGGVLQAIGQVVAAGFSLSDQIGDSATLVKMLRVLMIGPVVMLVSLFNQSKGLGNKNKFIPTYIIGFIICSVIGSLLPGDTLVIPYLRQLAKLLLTVAMAGVGLKIRFSSLLVHGPKALLFGVLINVVQILYILGVLLIFM